MSLRVIAGPIVRDPRLADDLRGYLELYRERLWRGVDGDFSVLQPAALERDWTSMQLCGAYVSHTQNELHLAAVVFETCADFHARSFVELRIHVDHRHRRRGIATQLLRFAELNSPWPSLERRASIALDNKASLALFKRAGFRYDLGRKYHVKLATSTQHQGLRRPGSGGRAKARLTSVARVILRRLSPRSRPTVPDRTAPPV